MRKKKATFFSNDRKLPFHNQSNVKEINNNYGEKIIRIDGDISPDLEITPGQRFLFISFDQSRYTHGLHKYPAKFFPELPRWLIQRYSKPGDLILDPFTGSGTTNVEAIMNQRHSIGIDIDPFARFLSKVKTRKLELFNLKNNVNSLLSEIVKFNPKYISKKELPDFPYRDNWFNFEILQELAFLKKIIIGQTDGEIKDFLLITLSSIIRQVSNADNNCTRTVVRKKLNKKIYPSMALTKFAEKLLLNTYRMEEFVWKCTDSTKTIIPDGSDAKNIKYEDNTFDLALTSPPYVNAVDYPRTHQLEIYWLGIMSGSLTPLKRKHIGTESVFVKDYGHKHSIGIEEADIVINKIYKQDPRRAYIAYKYLYDMKTHLIEVYRVLKKNAKYVVVVGNNRIRGELFENWKYLISIAESIGFRVDNYFASEIIKHFIKVPREERINTDWIIVLKKHTFV